MIRYFVTSVIFTLLISSALAQRQFVKSSNGTFSLFNKPLYYIGTNYWYGGLLGITANGKLRLQKELNFLKKNNVTNVRVIVGAEGSGQINGIERIQPSLQPMQRKFNTDMLKGLDYLLVELGKRNMKAVLVLSNNWEWSGGFLQYLHWNGLLPDSILRRKLTWDENRDLVSKFYTCTACKNDYNKQVEFVLNRTNKYSGKKYINDEAIMAWELANEPRPMRPVAIPAYKKWIATVASIIKQKDKNHLVTIGTEGYIGTENIEVFEAIHADKNIDYLTIHIWPKNWSWFNGTDIEKDYENIVTKTKEYIIKHADIAKKINKPLVIEEFGLPRDAVSFSTKSTTIFRDKFYKEIFTLWQQSKSTNGNIAACNFWAFGGTARPKVNQIFWKIGDDYMGDPPMEEQGLNTVFDSDRSTWKLILAYTNRKDKMIVE
jgi:mannan endo-1,4-beta-mannosidase